MRAKSSALTAPLPGSGTRSDAPIHRTPILSVNSLSVRYGLSPDQSIDALRRVSLELHSGGTLAIVGESGSGKSTIAAALLGLLPGNAVVTSGRVVFDGQDTLGLQEKAFSQLRGARLARVPQDPLSSLNPVFTIGFQVGEAIRAHRRIGRRQIRQEVVRALQNVGLADAEAKVNAYPHQLSGGMRQRVLIAMAIINGPDVLVADEPTTALDATVQAQVLALLRRVTEERSMALVLITHDLAVARSVCDEVLVMFRGEVVERGPSESVLARPQHPYTQSLLAAASRGRGRQAAHREYEREHTNLLARDSSGTADEGCCLYRDRCPIGDAECLRHPDLVSRDGASAVRCVHPSTSADR